MRGQSRFISAVAFYGPKTGRLREFLTGVQALIAEHVGGDFRPYTLEQVHATLIALNGVREGGTIVNEYMLEHTGERREMDLPLVMDILARRFATPLRVRIGGFRPEQAVPFTSRGQHLAERTFSVQGEAFVLVGWPADSLAGAGMPVDALRREMNAAGVLHRYHARPADVDNDLHLVVGHHAGARPARSPGPPPPSGTSWPPTRRTWPSACPTSRSSRPTRTRWRRRSTSAAFRLPRTTCWRLCRDRDAPSERDAGPRGLPRPPG